jgi:hypothetical protein
MHQILARVAVKGVVYLLAAASTVVAVVYATLAAFLAVADRTSPSVAAGLIALGAIALAAAVLLAMRVVEAMRGKTGVPNETNGEALDARTLVAELGFWLGQEGVGQARAHPYRAIGISLLAGMAVGMSPQLRAVLRGAKHAVDD